MERGKRYRDHERQRDNVGYRKTVSYISIDAYLSVKRLTLTQMAIKRDDTQGRDRQISTHRERKITAKGSHRQEKERDRTRETQS